MIFGILVLVFLGVVGGVVYGATRMFGPKATTPDAGAGNTARRIVLYALQFLLVTLTAVGVGGLLGLLLPDGDVIAGTDNLALARSLAFTLIAGPLALGLWNFLWKRIDATERASTGWPLYVSAMGFVSLVVATIALLTTASDLVAGRWNGQALATGLVWSGVCVWHWWMSHHSTKSPVNITDLLPVAGSSFGLVLTAGGSAALITSLIDEALFASDVTRTTPWWEFPTQAAVWAVVGGFIWWWYRIREGVVRMDGGLADSARVILGTAVPVLVAMGGAVGLVFTVLTLAFEDTSFERAGEGLPPAIAATVVGLAIWAIHRRVLGERVTARRIATLLVAGFGLAAAASSIGVIVNAGLEAITQSLVETDRLSLLFGGISALVVGAPVWFLNWKPTANLTDDPAAFKARSVYLVVVFGASALAALITLLVIAYRVLVYVLESGTGFIDEVRAPFGLLVATGLVAAYHYPVWRRDRALAATIEKPRSIDHVILVTGADPDPLRHVIVDSTGAAVTVWRRSDSHESGPTIEHLTDALSHTSGKRVMVVTGPGAHLDVITLEG